MAGMVRRLESPEGLPAADKNRITPRTSSTTVTMTTAKSGLSFACSPIVGGAKAVDGRIAWRAFASQMPGRIRGRGSRTTRELVMGEAKRRRLARQAGQTEEGDAAEAAVMAAAREVGEQWLSIPANLRRVEELEKGRWIDVKISAVEGRSPMVLRITKASKNRMHFQLFAVK
jgi:hypothetical protein